MTTSDSILFLLGAGSNPLVGTRGITDHLLGWRSYRAPGTDDRGNPRLSELGGTDAREPFYTWLARETASLYAPAAKTPATCPVPVSERATFEDLIYTVERLEALTTPHYYDALWDRPPSFDRPFVQLSLPGLAFAGAAHEVFDLIIGSCATVLDYVGARCPVGAPSETRDFIESFSGRRRRVFSFNYDTTAIDVAKQWWTGFEVGGDGRFQPVRSMPDKDTFVQLHGSTHFSYVEHPYRAPLWVLRRMPAPVANHRAPRRIGFDWTSDRAAIAALPMITGYRKADKILVEPYASYFSYLRQGLFEARRWIVMGYGGRDLHANAVLRTASDASSDLRIFVYNRLDEAKRSDADATQAWIRDVLWPFGRIGRVSVSDVTSAIPRDGILYLSPALAVSVDGRIRAHEDDVRRFLAV